MVKSAFVAIVQFRPYNNSCTISANVAPVLPVGGSDVQINSTYYHRATIDGLADGDFGNRLVRFSPIPVVSVGCFAEVYGCLLYTSDAADE